MILSTLRRWIHTLPTPPTAFVVALSGGKDSTVLLHALHTCAFPVPLRAIHVNHQLQEAAASFEQTALQTCQRLSVPCQAVTVTLLSKPGYSLETMARTARYQIFQNHLQPGEWLLTAHHAQDNAETFLHRACKGAGVKGLSGMAAWRSLGHGFLGRPLLSVASTDILAYATQEALTWVEDPTNQDTTFSRNFARHQVLPLLKTHYPGVIAALNRAARHCQEAEALLEGQAQQDLAYVQSRATFGLSVPLLRTLSFIRQKNCLRQWIYQQHQLPPHAAQLDEYVRQLNTYQRGAPSLTWPGGQWSVRQKHLFFIPQKIALSCPAEEGRGRG